MKAWLWLFTGLAFSAAAASGCGGSNTPTAPSTPSTPTPPVTAALAAPVIISPRGGQQLTDFGPMLSTANAVAAGTVTNVRYRFEWSELDGFPTDSRTGSRDGVDQGGNTTSHVITGTLKPNFKYYWRVRASTDALTSPWSNVENFVTTNRGFIVGQTIYDPLTDGSTVGSRFGGSFVSGQGWRADSDSDGIDYVVPGGCVSCTVEFDVTNFGRAQGAAALKDYKWISMGDGSTFGDFTAFRDHPWKVHLEQRSDGDGTGMKLIWRNGASVEGANPGDHMQRNDSTIDWRPDVVYRFTLRWTPGDFTVSVGMLNADGSVSGSRVWFSEGFGAFPYAPPNFRISLGTRSRSETMRGAIWRNFKLTSN